MKHNLNAKCVVQYDENSKEFLVVHETFILRIKSMRDAWGMAHMFNKVVAEFECICEGDK